MKPLLMIAMAAIALTLYAKDGEQGKHLFILSGQSNMEYLDPNVSFIPAVIEAFGKDNVIVVKDHEGGQPIRRWYKNWKPAKGDEPKVAGDVYERLMTKVKVAIENKKLESVTFVWMQGESDALEKQGELYAASLKGLIAQLQKDLSRSDINVVIGRLSDSQTSPDWTMVRKAQVDVAESNNRYAWVDTDDLNGAGNDIHYDTEGSKTLGKRFADKAIKLINNKPNK